MKKMFCSILFCSIDPDAEGQQFGFRAKLKSDEPAYLSPVTPIMTPGGLPLLRVGFMKLIFS